TLDDARLIAVRITLVHLFVELRRLDDKGVALPPSGRVTIPFGKTVLFGNDSIPEVDPSNLVVRFVDNRYLIRPLNDLHGIAAGTQHRSRHAGAETVASGCFSGSRDQTLIFLHLRLRFGPQGQFRLRPPTAAACSAPAAGASICSPNTRQVWC